MNKIAIFSAGDGSQRRQPCVDGPLSHPMATMAKSGIDIYSTGQIEAALAQGYTVYVIGNYHDTEPHDQWWIDLVGELNVFSASEKDKKKLSDEPWRRLARRLKIASKINWRDYRLDVIREIYRLSGAKKASDFVV
ncbi:MAG: hypothetical protein UT02_C0015G0005 [Parcubacteria group bacterium GW2011_GWC2_38_7]|nr:MAG: hypothetical protein UT02_C0015G0005 [Parcubacteria group bacterium GW2011_GWC2_38_7]